MFVHKTQMSHKIITFASKHYVDGMENLNQLKFMLVKKKKTNAILKDLRLRYKDKYFGRRFLKCNETS